MDHSIESTFCFKYLNNFISIKRSTIESLVSNDYHSIQSLLAFDLDLDLNQLPNVSMGQKSILREALIKLKKEFNLWIKEETHSTTFFSSTPKKYPFVADNDSFNKLILSVKEEITGEHTTDQKINKSLNTCVDSGFNELKSSPKKKIRSSKESTPQKLTKIISKVNPKSSLKKRIRSSKESTPQKLTKIISKVSPKLSPNKSIKKRKKKKFLYSMKTLQSRKNKTTKNKKQTISGPKVSIDLDMDSMNDSTDDNLMSDDNPIIDVSTNPIKDENSVEDPSLLTTHWKSRKSELTRLIKQRSNRVDLLEDKLVFKDMSDYYSIVVIDKIKSPFVVCNHCMASDNCRLLLTTQLASLRKHLKSNLHKNDSIALNLSEKQTELTNQTKSPIKESSVVSVEVVNQKTVNQKIESEVKSIETIEKKVVKERGRKKKKKECCLSPNNSIIVIDLLSTVRKPNVNLHKININFDETKGKYLAELTNDNKNESPVVVHNYGQVLEEINSKKQKINSKKPYKCDFDGCHFSTAYPFSLEQHKIRSHTIEEKSEVLISDPNKSLLLEGMNAYVYNYMKKSNDLSNSELIKDNWNVDTSDQMVNSVPFVCQSPDCKYSSQWLLSVKKHMINNHNIDYVSQHNNDNSFSRKIVDKMNQLIKN